MDFNSGKLRKWVIFFKLHSNAAKTFPLMKQEYINIYYTLSAAQSNRIIP